MSEEDAPPENTSAVVVTHPLSKNLKDKFVHYIDPDSDQCPKCGMHGAVSKGECQSCGCWIQFSKEKAGTKESVASVQAKMEQKPQKGKKPKPTAKKPAEDEEEPEEESQDEDEDIEVEAATVKPRDLALALVKKAKGVLKESAGLIGQHFSELVITFDPFVVKVKEKPKAIDI